MTLTLSLPPEIERRLQDNAKSKGISIENYALELLDQHTAFSDLSKDFYSLPPDERVRQFLAWAEDHDHITSVVDDSRESIYKGCGE